LYEKVFLDALAENDTKQEPAFYVEWLQKAFGEVFTDTVPAIYT
jgi:hypothetical protein